MKDNISRSSIFRDSMRRKAEERKEEKDKGFNNSRTQKKETNESYKKPTQQEIEDFWNDR